METGCGECGHYAVDVFFADQFEQVFGPGPGGECAGVNQAFFYVLRNVDGLAFEAFVHKAAVGYDVSRKYQAALLGYADCFA